MANEQDIAVKKAAEQCGGTPMEPERSQVWQVRAAAWELLALSLRCPERELAQAVASGEWYEAAREILAALETDEVASEWAACHYPEADRPEPPVQSNQETVFHELRAEYTHLFVGVRRPPVSPYEGIWSAEDVGVDPLLFVNPKSLAVEHFCRACGLGNPQGVNEPLDHVATECELLQYLALLASGLAIPPASGPQLHEFPGGSPQAAYGEFLETHVRPWMPRFAQKALAEARVPFYRAAAALLAAVVDSAA